MEFVRQREALDDGLAAVAMLIGCTYVEARDAALELKAWTSKVGMKTPGLIATLRAFGARPGETLIRLPARHPWGCDGDAVLKVPGIERVGHYIVWDGRRVYDPALERPMGASIWMCRNGGRFRGQKRRWPSSYLPVDVEREEIEYLTPGKALDYIFSIW